MAAYLTLNSAGLSMLLVLNAGENSNTKTIIGSSITKEQHFLKTTECSYEQECSDQNRYHY